MTILLEEELLKEYTPYVYKVGVFLLNNNYSTLDTIITGVDINKNDITETLDFMIKVTKIVTIKKYYEKIFYIIDKTAIKNRLFYPLYTTIIYNKYGELYSDIFTKYLINDTLLINRNDKEAEMLIKENVFIERQTKDKHTFQIIVNYPLLNQMVITKIICEYLLLKYDSFTSSIYKVIAENGYLLKFDFINSLCDILSKAPYNYSINNNSQIVSSLGYLESAGFVLKNPSSHLSYIIKFNISKVKAYYTGVFLDNYSEKRLFHLIKLSNNCSGIDENYLTFHSLLLLPLQKSTLISLIKKGIVKESINLPGKINSKIISTFYTNEVYYSKSILFNIEKQLKTAIVDKNFYLNEKTIAEDNDTTMKILKLSTYYLLFSYQ